SHDSPRLHSFPTRRSSDLTAGETPGEVAVMASYLSKVDTFRALVPRAEKIADYPKVPENNFVDALVFARLRRLNIVPSDLADDRSEEHTSELQSRGHLVCR